jgi:hypothetical protein
MHLFPKIIKNTSQDTRAQSKHIRLGKEDSSSSRFVFPIKAKLSKPAVCKQSSQIGRPTTGIDPPIVEEELRSDGWHHARNESGVQGSTERKGM